MLPPVIFSLIPNRCFTKNKGSEHSFDTLKNYDKESLEGKYLLLGGEVMKKKLAMVLTGVAVCSVLMMGCQSNAGGDASDDVQTEDVNPADDVAEPETEPIPEATTAPDETESGTDEAAAPEATTAPEGESSDTEGSEASEGEASNAEGAAATDGTEADSENAEGEDAESTSEGEEKKAE